MQIIKDYLKSLSFSLSYSFKFVPRQTLVMLSTYVLSGLLPYGSAFLLGKLVNTIILGTQNESFNDIWYILIIYAFLNGLPTIVGNLQLYLNRIRMLTLQMAVEEDFLRHRESIDIATYEDPKFQDLVQRSFRNGLNPMWQLGNEQFNVVRALTSFILGTVLAIHFDFWIYVVVMLTAIPAFIMDIKYAGKSWSIWAKDSPEQRKLKDLREHFVYRTQLFETKLFQAGKKLLAQIKKIFSDFANVQINLEKKRVWSTTVADVISLLGFAGGLFLVVRGLSQGEAQAGTLVYILGTLSNVRSSIASLLESISGQYENNLIVKDMIEFINTKPTIVDQKNPQILGIKSAPEIVFENVSFKYQGSEKHSLKNLSLTFKAGDNIGLVGNNGAGKTTLVKLLCRIYDPTEGRILINGIDLKEVSTKEWWSYLAVMFQDYATYDFLVKDAIAISRPEKGTNLTKVVEASKIAQSHDFIMEWQGKYDEQLGVEFKGKEPSKGQRQKLSIAKILYRDGFVMVLDEPTASVDAESESKIFDSIENLPKDRTAIMISHDFSTISACDKIFVMDKGTLIEEGNHKELMKTKGMYAELYNLQAKRFKK